MELRDFHTDATASNDEVTLGSLSDGADVGLEAIERSRGNAGADTEA